MSLLKSHLAWHVAMRVRADDGKAPNSGDLGMVKACSRNDGATSRM